MRLERGVWIPIAVHFALFVLVVTGLVPRSIVPFWTVAAMIWAGFATPDVSVTVFITLIPFFVAIPLATDFDNFNMWRPVALVIAVRWFLMTQSWRSVWATVVNWARRPLHTPFSTVLIAIAAIAVVSVSQAVDVAAAFRRIIYFANISFVPVVVFMTLRTGALPKSRLYAAMAWSSVAVISVAFLQLASTYLMDVYAFMRIWGEGIQLRQYGALWSQIVVSVGNTWLAYYGPQLSLRVFSVFPDSHSFPVYLLMSLGGIVALTLTPLWHAATNGVTRLRSLAGTRATLGVLWLPLGLLAIILSGTRGIWAASIGLSLVIIVLELWMRRGGILPSRRALFRYVSLWLVCYLLLFAIAWPIFISPQFLLSGGDRNLFANRLRSIIDLGETSNAARLLIWDATIESISAHPLLGVGIGNYPAVLGQRVILAKAGSSAHNAWLHVAAEIGVVGFVLWCLMWALTYRSAWFQFTRSATGPSVLFAGWMLLALPWLAAYLMTDSALFDERTLLMFGIVIAILRTPLSHER